MDHVEGNPVMCSFSGTCCKMPVIDFDDGQLEGNLVIEVGYWN